MRVIVVFGLFVFCLSMPVQAEFVGAELPLTDGPDDDGSGTPDGWSGIPVMYGHQLPAGESVNTVRYYADQDREFELEDELYNVVPLIVMQEDGSIELGDGVYTVWEVGPVHMATESGEQEFAWGSSPIPDDGNLYHPAALQWQLDNDNSNGGVISFNGSGEGMHYFDVNTTDYVPEDGDFGEVEADLFLSDLTIHSSGFGGRHYQLNFETGSAAAPGDFDADGDLDGVDIEALSAEIRNMGADSKFDVSGDGAIDGADRTEWVKGLRMTWFGDSNLDGEFNSSDFVGVFQEGKYETEQPATWTQGDWDGDGFFNSSDFVVAFQDGGFEQGPLAATSAVPEPSAISLLLIGGLFVVGKARGRR